MPVTGPASACPGLLLPRPYVVTPGSGSGWE
jgi:hypothetical protein